MKNHQNTGHPVNICDILHLDRQIGHEYSLFVSYPESKTFNGVRIMKYFQCFSVVVFIGCTIFFMGCGKESLPIEIETVLTDEETSVEFPDVNLAHEVCKALNLPKGAAIPKSKLATLKSLRIYRQNESTVIEKIYDLTGIEHATQLHRLDLCGVDISDISLLSHLTHLKELNLWGNDIRDIRPLSHLTRLTALALDYNDISDIRPLSHLARLKKLELDNNRISDISPLAELTELKELFLRNNKIRAYLINILVTYVCKQEVQNLNNFQRSIPNEQLNADNPLTN